MSLIHRTALKVLDEMIRETEGRERQTPVPPSAGARQRVDGEALGTFLRATILKEARERIRAEVEESV